jgi:hypothetical protein
VTVEKVDDNAAWEAHRREHIGLWMEATPAQRMAWLEEMIELAHRTGALPRPSAHIDPVVEQA